jgi:antitoxin component YwqK of YwqJK toxin-antitoxin module
VTQDNVEIRKAYYYESGDLMCEIPYVNGERHGIAKEYYESGALEWEIPYVNEKEHGVEKHYDSDKLNIDCLRLYDKGCEVLILCCESYGTVSKTS